MKIPTQKTTSYSINVAPSLNRIKTKGNNVEITIKIKLFVFNPAKVWHNIHSTNSFHDMFCSHLSLRLTNVFKSTIITQLKVNMETIPSKKKKKVLACKLGTEFPKQLIRLLI